MKQIILIITVFTILSCTPQKRVILTLKTDLPEILPLIEDFNKENKSIKIQVEVGLDESEGDIVIFRGQPTSSPYKTSNIESIFSNRLKKDSFYKDILKTTDRIDGTRVLLPLSFDLSGVMYNNKQFNNLRVIKIEDFISDQTIRFSPFWNNEFNLWYYLSNIPSFDKDKQYLDSQLFSEVSNRVKNMVSEENDRWDEAEFNKIYMHLSPEFLINSNMIEYYFVKFSYYVNMKIDYKKNIDFSFLSSNDLLIANDSLTYIGLTESSKYKKQGMTLLTWLFQPTNQNKYMTNNIQKSGLDNLFLNQLSSLIEVTEKDIPKHYPKLVG
ncbi:MAG: hypothetical protein B6229_05135 [Spirochaetaceae bacterium 4572_7]|nr:MAG: hypothetical protein B6229_05135 [Spirochaetaceae bacterium 4572_7]